MSNDAKLARRVGVAGQVAGEPTWELPLYAPYRKQLDSDVADIKNVSSGNGASAVMAALFLEEFTDGRPWAHLDIAGPGWSDSDDGWITKGGTGWGTRTLIELVRAWR
jgi:leucyl aminopeptidase